jgi:hypothetical protein
MTFFLNSHSSPLFSFTHSDLSLHNSLIHSLTRPHSLFHSSLTHSFTPHSPTHCHNSLPLTYPPNKQYSTSALSLTYSLTHSSPSLYSNPPQHSTALDSTTRQQPMTTTDEDEITCRICFEPTTRSEVIAPCAW